MKEQSAYRGGQPVLSIVFRRFPSTKFCLEDGRRLKTFLICWRRTQIEQFIRKETAGEICRHGSAGFNRGHKYDVRIAMSLAPHWSYCAFYGHLQPLWPRMTATFYYNTPSTISTRFMPTLLQAIYEWVVKSNSKKETQVRGVQSIPGFLF